MGAIILKTAKRRTSVSRSKIQAAVKAVYAANAGTASQQLNGTAVLVDASAPIVTIIKQGAPRKKKIAV